jgi:DNA mismatch repair protein MutL
MVTAHDEPLKPTAQNDSAAMSVQVLPSDLVNQIAAGEVVERPASAVKELVENAIDAGAGSIEVFLEQGGRKLIEVRDDGCGMNAADARLALERHATSKLRTFDDLLAVATLGFRGEALPSIASVSRFSLTTWDGREPHGVVIEADPALGLSVRPAARDRGTTVSVRELFENVPARRKFLKSADAEFRSIVSVVTSYALPEAGRSFLVSHNGRAVLDLPAASDRRERVVQILGEDVREALAPIELRMEGCTVSGFVTRGIRYGSKRHQYFFVNGRLVKDRVLTHAVGRAAERFDFDGHPAVVLFIDIARDLVDVNVHPAKTEVRFRDSGLVHVAAEEAVRRALGGAEEGSSLLGSPAAATVSIFESGRPAEQPPASSGGFGPPSPLFPSAPARSGPPPSAHELTPLFRQRPVVQPPVEPAPASPRLGALEGRVIGQYRLSYILLDTPDGLRLVDQHVAHERILFDRYLQMIENRSPSSQRLLAPYLYEAPPTESAVLQTHLDELRALGFEIEPFSRNTLAVSAIPVQLERERLDRFFRSVIDASMEEKTPHLTRVRERIVASLACQAAIKVHRPLSGEEMARLVEELLGSSNPFACPHGRPIIVDIRHVDIERHFHRR